MKSILQPTLRSFLLATACAVAGPAAAVEYTQVQPAASKLDFTFRQMNVPIAGNFRRFNVLLAFDPAHPEQGKATFEVDLASVDVGSAEANDEVGGKDWFNFKATTSARFVAQSFRALGNDRYEVRGPLALKGRSREVSATFTLQERNGQALVDGTFPLRRLEFGIGEGSWGDPSVVADQVDVRFHLVATPAAGKSR
jgi:polyisoprenoid-binding protein YceI